MRPAGFALLSWLALVGLWLLFVGTATRGELYAGMAAAVVAGLALELTRGARLLAYRPDVRQLASSWRLPLEIASDLGIVLAAAGRACLRRTRVRGSFVHVSTSMRGGGRRAAWRRAFAESAGSLSPNRIVVDVDPGEGEALLHALDTRPASVRRLP
jgi:multisubunit Na+/H+ antiporter MnhE subunit